MLVAIVNAVTTKIGVIMTKIRKLKKKDKKPMIGTITTIYHQEEEREKLMHSYCLRCGKKLKNIEYRKIGYGPICYQKVNVKNNIKLF